MTAIDLRQVSKAYGAVQVIGGIDLRIEPGEFMVFVGPSGCGKSTLLRMIAGLEDITSGDLLFDGRKVNALEPSARGVAMVFQSYALYPHMSVRQNMAFGLTLEKRLTKAQIAAKVEAAADMLQMRPYLDRLPKQLSGGQRQRVAIGRAITRDPRVFLFDEPLSNLDAALRVATRIEIAALHARMAGTTMIYVTHDQVEAMTLASRICVLNAGRVEQVGTPLELYAAPQSLFVAGFIGSPRMNLLGGDHAAHYRCATLGIRAEHLRLDDAGPWAGRVIHVESLGADTFAYLDIAQGDPLVIRLDGASRPQPGQMLRAAALPGHVHRFDSRGARIAA